MQVKRTDVSDSQVVLVITGDSDNLSPMKEHVLKEHFAKDIKVPGFRAGKAPLALVEKQVDQRLFQNQFLEEAVNDLFQRAVSQEKLRTVDQPTISIMKFVPYTQLEIEAKVEILPKVTLADYKKIKLAMPKPKTITTSDINGVIENIGRQISEKKDVNRAAKLGDQTYIDFEGKDSKGKPVSGADGQNYPLVLGSNSFIPGFEENLVGLKGGEEKTFTLKFPKDYSVKALASKDVSFHVTMEKVQAVVMPEVDDAFAAKVGPFKNLSELKEDIKRQLEQEKAQEASRDYESALLKEITTKSKVKVPEILLNDEVDKRLRDLNQNLEYRGQTMEEFLDIEGKTEKEFIEEVLKPESEERLKASIVLSEISEVENIELTNQEVDDRLQLMRQQYRDPQSQEELTKPEVRRDVASRMLAEKTIQRLSEYVAK